jgi:hypothetical protein
VFVVGVSHNSSPNSLVVHNRQNQCSAGFHCSEVRIKFSLLLKLVKVLNLRLTEFCELFIELRHCFGPLSD